MGETMIAPPPPEETPADSFFSRAIGVFISPGRTFESIARRPDFLAPLIIMTVVSIVVIEAMLQKIGVAHIIRKSIEMSKQGSQLSPEQIDQAVQRAAGITAIMMRVGGVLGVAILVLIIAAVGLFFVNVLFGGSASFKACFSVVSYANLVLLISSVLALVMILLGDPEQFNADNFLPTTVGFFLNPNEVSKPLYAAANSFDIFRVWFIFLSSVGLSRATGKKVGTAAVFFSFLGVWVLIVLAKVGWAAMMG